MYVIALLLRVYNTVQAHDSNKRSASISGKSLYAWVLLFFFFWLLLFVLFSFLIKTTNTAISLRHSFSCLVCKFKDYSYNKHYATREERPKESEILA